jgi:hypothetical protein
MSDFDCPSLVFTSSHTFVYPIFVQMFEFVISTVVPRSHSMIRSENAITVTFTFPHIAEPFKGRLYMDKVCDSNKL